MEMIVTGFVDPQIFRGEYIEAPTIEFNDLNGKKHSVRKGDPIGNFELSGLRAVFAQRLVEELLLKRARTWKPCICKVSRSRSRYLQNHCWRRERRHNRVRQTTPHPRADRKKREGKVGRK